MFFKKIKVSTCTNLTFILVRNYRSHQDIIKIPSELFYHDELLPCAEDSITEAYLGLDFLLNVKCPLVFHGVRGKNFQEGLSPSWFNPTEAFQVSRYFQQLLNSGVKCEHVGIIAPYRQQISKLRQIFQSLELPIPKVSTFKTQWGLTFLVFSNKLSNSVLKNL